MNIHATASFIALVSYIGLWILVFTHSLRKHRPSQLFALYLFLSILLQVGYLIVSLADTAETALLGYNLVTPCISGQIILYYFFIQVLLGHPIARKWIWIGILALGISVILELSLNSTLIFTDISRDAMTGIFVPEFSSFVSLLGILVVGFWGCAFRDLIRSWKNARTPYQRIRLQYLLLGMVISLLGSMTNVFPAFRPYPLDVLANIINAGVIAYAILRHQLLDIRIVIRSGLAYSIPTAILGTGYYFLIYWVIRLFHTAGGTPILVLSLGGAAVIALAVRPLHDIAQRWLDKAFFREKYDYGLMLERLSRVTASVLDLEQLAYTILDDVVSTLHLQWIAFYVGEEQSHIFRMVAQRGLAEDRIKFQFPGGLSPLPPYLKSRRALFLEELKEHQAAYAVSDAIIAALVKMETELIIPLCAEDEIIGILLLGAKYSGENYSQADETALITLANQTAIAFNNARLHQKIIEQLNERHEMESALWESDKRLSAFFAQSIDGCFFMMLETPVYWNHEVDKEAVLDYVFMHQYITQVNDAMLQQYRARRDEFFGLTPNDFFVHDLVQGRRLWHRLFDEGKVKLESRERRFDGTDMWVEGEYICLYDAGGRITGHFGIQRDVTARKQVEAEVQRHVENMNRVSQLAIELTAVSPGSDIYSYIAQELQAMTRSLAVGIAIYDDHTQELVVKYVAGPRRILEEVNRLLQRNLIGLRLKVAPSLKKRMLTQIVNTEQDLHETTFGVIPKPIALLIQKAIRIGYFTGITLQHGNELLGTAVIVMPEGSDVLAVDWLKTIGHVLTGALNRRKGEEELWQHNRELELINRVGQVFNSTLELDVVLNNALHEIRHLLNVTTCSIWLQDAQTGELVCEQAASVERKSIRGWRLEPGRGIVGWVIQHNAPLLVSETEDDPRHYIQIAKQTKLYLHTILAVPLQAKGAVIGVLEIADVQANRLTQEDVPMATALAATAATAIENARLYRQTQQDALAKAALLKEVNHRVGNNLSSIIGLLNAESRYVPDETRKHVEPILTRLTQRVRGLAEVHSLLSQSQWSPIKLDILAQKIIYAALNALPADQYIQVTISPSPVTVFPRYASNLALVFNELATNTIKYALLTRTLGHISVNISTDDRGYIVCEYRDDGPGYPKSTLHLEDYDVGLYLVQRLVKMALYGELELFNDHGAVTLMRFEPDINSGATQFTDTLPDR
ncbi:MAG: GAF domain-containing protein [Anaerolineae bacterium]|nr:GAF domain-containing protein [Anaerolineae bacterium]